MGEIVEYRTHYDQLQKSYCYLARVVGAIGKPNFDYGELEDGFKVRRMSLAQAEECLRSVTTEDYSGRFVIDRELMILEEVKKYL